MPLLAPALTTALLRAFRGATSPASAAAGMADAYARYAQTGTAGAAPPILTGLEKMRLEQVLLGALAAPSPTPAAFAQAWGAGLASFWAGVAFPGGAATALPGALAVPAGVSLALGVPQPAEVAAGRVAVTLDAATRTLVVVIGGIVVPFV